MIFFIWLNGGKKGNDMKKISFIIPCYCSEKTIETVCDEIEKLFINLEEYDYEIILVNDFSPDKTFHKIRKLCSENSKIIGLNLAKNFGQHSALMAGFHYTSGEIIVCLDDDGQTPPDEAFKLINKIEEGYDVVYAKYLDKKHSGFRNWGSKINTKMTEYLLEKPKELYLSSYFAARKFVVDQMLKYDNSYPYVIGLVLRTTRNITNVVITHKERQQGMSGYTLKKLISLWVNGFTAFSVKPLRIATIIGLICSIVGVICTIWTIINKFVNSQVPMGWSSTMAVILVIGGLILFVLGIIGEYIGRIYICLNHSPQYVVRDCVNYNKES